MKKPIGIIVLISLSLSLGAVYHKVGEFLEIDYAQKIDIRSNIAYVVEGSDGLITLDISDPLNPEILYMYNWHHTCTCGTVVENNAYIVFGEWDSVNAWYDYFLYILDISDPANPQTLSTYELSNSVKSIWIRNDYLIAFETYGLGIYDISNPEAIEQIELFQPTGYDPNGILDGSHAYFVSPTNGLQIADISDPENPEAVGAFFHDEMLFGVAIEDDVAYIPCSSEVIAVDVSDPANPALVGSCDCDRTGFYCSIEDDVLYIANSVVGFSAIDISDPTNPEYLSDFDTIDGAQQVAVKDGLAYVADLNAGIQIIDVSDPTITVVAGSSDECGYAQSIDIENDIAYIAGGRSGLKILDISTPEMPFFLGEYWEEYEWPSYYYVQDVAVKDGYAYIINDMDALQVVNATNPRIPELSDWLQIDDDFRDVTIAGHIAYLATSSYGRVDFVNISNPSNVFVTTSFTPSYSTSVWSTVVTEDDLYLLLSTDGVHRVTLQVLGYNQQYDTTKMACDIAMNGDVAYIADRDSLIIADWSDLYNPQYVTSIRPHRTSWITHCLYDQDRLIFPDNNWNEIYIYDVQEALNPVHMLTIPWNGKVSDMIVYENMLYVTANGRGMIVFDLHYLADDPDDIPQYEASLSNYPNPFNPSTTIAFSIPTDSRVTLDVFNIRGQKVRTLLDERLERGEHSVQWTGDDDNGKPCSSGVYLYRMKAGDTTKTSRMLLMK